MSRKCFEFPNKRRYNTCKDAQTAILLSDNSKQLNAYCCETCKGWHLTSKAE